MYIRNIDTAWIDNFSIDGTAEDVTSNIFVLSWLSSVASVEEGTRKEPNIYWQPLFFFFVLFFLLLPDFLTCCPTSTSRCRGRGWGFRGCKIESFTRRLPNLSDTACICYKWILWSRKRISKTDKELFFNKQCIYLIYIENRHTVKYLTVYRCTRMLVTLELVCIHTPCLP